MAYAKSILVCLRVRKDRGPGALCRGCGHRAPWCFRSCPCTHLTWVQLSFWFLTCLSFFCFVSFLALFTFLFTSIYLACSLTLSDALILESNLWPLPFLVNAEASSIIVGSSVLDSKCWYKCTPCTGASTWSTLLDLNTSKDWKFQWVLEIHFEK